MSGWRLTAWGAFQGVMVGMVASSLTDSPWGWITVYVGVIMAIKAESRLQS